MYATLAQTKTYLRQLGETLDDGLLTTMLKSAQDIVNKYSGWDFIPRRKTIAHNTPVSNVENVGAYGGYYYSIPQVYRDQRQLRLTEPLLELESVTNGDATVVTLSNILLFDPTIYPKYELRLTKASDLTWEMDADDQSEQVISVVGLWGYHETYEDAWIDSLDTVQDNPLTISVTSLTVDNADGVAGDGESDRFQVGQVLKITDGTDYEFVSITAISLGADGADDTLTITRGYRGTVAKEWPQTTPIFIYRPMYGVRQATMEIARLLYRRKDLDSGDTKQIIGTNIKITPTTLPDYITAMLPEPRSWL